MERTLRPWRARIASAFYKRPILFCQIPNRTPLCLRFRHLASTIPPANANIRGVNSPNGIEGIQSIQLRDYQEESIQSVLEHLEKGHNRLGLSLATGAGKTVVFTQLIGRIPPRNGTADQTIIIAHRKELVEQAAYHCRRMYPDKTVEIEMGPTKASGAADITIASIRSLASKDRIEKFDPSRFKLVLVDEAHHIVAPQYREVLAYFGLKEASDNAPALVGVSATFFRFDGLKLGSAIDYIVYHKDYVDMIGDKWLSDAVFTTVKTNVDLSRVAQDSSGDFMTKALSEAVNTATVNDLTVRSWLTNAGDRKSTLVFCVDTDHVRELTNVFREHGIDARYVTGTTSRQIRNKELEDFKKGEFPVLVNCGLFTEGTDIPNVDCVILARPTRSKGLLIQMIGRGLRLHPGKKNCYVIDMVSTLNTGVMSTPTLFGLDPEEALVKESVQEIREKKEAADSSLLENLSHDVQPLTNEDVNVTFTTYDSIYDLLQDERSDRHIRSLSRNAWVRVDNDRYVLAEKSGWITIERHEEDWDGRFVVKYVRKIKNDSKDPITMTKPRVIARAPDLEQAVHGADTFAAGHMNRIAIRASEGWRSAPATKSQLDFLNKKKIRSGVIGPGDITRGQAADMLTKLQFGTKARFEKEHKKRKKEEKIREEFERHMNQGNIRVGPLRPQE